MLSTKAQLQWKSIYHIYLICAAKVTQLSRNQAALHLHEKWSKLLWFVWYLMVEILLLNRQVLCLQFPYILYIMSLIFICISELYQTVR